MSNKTLAPINQGGGLGFRAWYTIVCIVSACAPWTYSIIGQKAQSCVYMNVCVYWVWNLCAYLESLTAVIILRITNFNSVWLMLCTFPCYLLSMYTHNLFTVYKYCRQYCRHKDVMSPPALSTVCNYQGLQRAISSWVCPGCFWQSGWYSTHFPHSVPSDGGQRSPG